MQYVNPCEFCGGVIKAQDNRWQCTECGATWTLGMRLIDEGHMMHAALDAIFGEDESGLAETLRIDTVYHYQPTPRHARAKCRLRIYHHEGRDVVILSEMSDNPGMSVTNASESLLTKLVQDYDLDLSTVFIEHYQRPEQETYDLILPLWDEETVPAVQWRRMALEEVERMTGAFFGQSAEFEKALDNLFDAGL